MARCSNRDRKKETFWRRMVRGHAGSGLSVRSWCRRQGLRESSFYWWRRQLSERDAEAPAWVPVRVTTDRPTMDGCVIGTEIGSPGRIEIVLPQGLRVRVVGAVNREVLADVLTVLTSTSSMEAAAC